MDCNGELMVNGFCIYKNSLHLSSDEIVRLQEMIDKKAEEFDNPVRIVIE